MRRVTKENLIAQIDRLCKIKDEQGQLSMSGEYTLQAYEMLLATMEVEPMVVTDEMAISFHNSMPFGCEAEVGEIKQGLQAALANVITQQPAPVVPDELLKEYLRLVDCMLSDYRDSNYGDAQRWIRHIAEASDAFEEKHGISPCEMARKNFRTAILNQK